MWTLNWYSHHVVALRQLHPLYKQPAGWRSRKKSYWGPCRSLSFPSPHHWFFLTMTISTSKSISIGNITIQICPLVLWEAVSVKPSWAFTGLMFVLGHRVLPFSLCREVHYEWDCLLCLLIYGKSKRWQLTSVERRIKQQSQAMAAILNKMIVFC